MILIVSRKFMILVYKIKKREREILIYGNLVKIYKMDFFMFFGRN